MPKFDIDGVSVEFPFVPYQVQRDYMGKVIVSLTKAENAVLESPTGTGKTLSLLCATLAWIEKEKENQRGLRFVKGTSENEEGMGATGSASILELLNNVNHSFYDVNSKNSLANEPKKIPKVIYASRTHSQILQAMNELKRSAYSYMKAGVIASRDQLCIKPELKDKPNSDKIHMCRSLVKKNECSYRSRVNESLNKPDLRQNAILDIEDLGRIGRKLQCCPFYVSKEKVKQADIVFMPYNYLLDPQIRKASQISLKNAIIILDEGHNVEKVCEESASTLITSTQIDTAIGNAEYAINCLNKSKPVDIDFTIDDIRALKSSIQSLKKEVDNISMVENGVNTHGGGYIFALLEKARINENNHELTISLLDKIIGCLVEMSAKKRKYVTGLRAVKGFLQTVFSSSAPDLRKEVDRCYKVYIEREPQNQHQPSTSTTKVVPNKNAKVVNFWCFSPRFGMQYLLDQGIRCLILTSGTLAPLEALISEMEISMPVRLKNPHIVENFQVHVKIVGRGPDEEILDSCYKNRDKREYLQSLGNTILEFSKFVPDGLLVFFPSYVLMNKSATFWRQNGIWSLIDKQKRIFSEPQTKAEFIAAMKGYYDTINKPDSNGAIFMAVMRGKVSEGLDFADMYGRAVIVTGIPFAPAKDPKVVLKQQYLNETKRNKRDNKMLSGSDWYVLDSIRAINQAIGRVIRHKNDYGGILFCDNRFHEQRNQNDISGWIQNHLHNQNSRETFDSMLKNVSKFFTVAKQRLPTPEAKVAPEEDIKDIFEMNANSIEAPIDSESSDSDEEERIDEPSTSQNSISDVSDGSQDQKNQRKKRKCNTGTDLDSDNEQNSPSIAKNPFIEIMKRRLGTAKYRELWKIVEKYDKDSEYGPYRDSLFKNFADECWTYDLKGMITFTKPMHRMNFENDVEALIQSRD
ncbi:regulator of telomere elongation helicase 1 homolog [Sitodiplosis mosellana]|uniref:regulator of telomere elongation helicase 1 homolog n=1 Tax=Sitodiplosis mosellana TaxID=263140 RepID=UPI002444A9C5|nr:regulator of telomere elongation helicase 1 homolog [Sitodiplosis mosellana]